MSSWSDCIEEPIRPVVKLLRENGINTTSSCGHDMYVECESYEDTDVTRVYNLLVEAGYDSFNISLRTEKVPGSSWQRTLIVEFPQR